MEKALFDRRQKDPEEAAEDEGESVPSQRRSIHSRSHCESTQIAACGDERTKEGCSGWWVLVILMVYGSLCVAVLLNCNHDKDCNQWVAWLLIFVGTAMTAAITMKCFNYSSRDGEIGCARWCSVVPRLTFIRRDDSQPPPFTVGVSVMRQELLGVTDTHRVLPEPKELPMPTMPSVAELARTRFTLDEQQ